MKGFECHTREIEFYPTAIVGHEGLYSQGMDINRLTAVLNLGRQASVLGGVCKEALVKAGLL